MAKDVETEVHVPLSRQIPVEAWAAFFFLLSVVYRLSFFGPSPFPLNDGAVFLRFLEDVARSGYGFPACVEFNHACIPFAYPPLSFYLTAALTEFGFTPLEITKWYPLFAHVVYSAIVFFVVRKALASDIQVLFCYTIFLFHGQAFEWLLMGGGISRVTAAIFFALSLLFVQNLRASLPLGSVVLCGLSVGASLLSHPEWGLGTVAAVTLYLALNAEDRRKGFVGLVAIGAISAAMIAPWLHAVIGLHGLAPFDNAAQTSEWNWLRSVLWIATLSFFAVSLKLPCAVGAVVLIRTGSLFWLLLLVAMQFLTPRSFPSMSALPMAVLAAVGLDAIRSYLGPRLGGLAQRWRLPRMRLPIGHEFVLAAMMAVYLIFMNKVNELSAGTLVQISDEAVAAMEWANANLPEDRKFVMITGQSWASDEIEEWFPLVTRFELLSLVRGTEWFEDLVWTTRRWASDDLNLESGCTAAIETVNRVYPGYDVVFDASGNGCFERLPGHRVIFANEEVKLIERARPAGPT